MLDLFFDRFEVIKFDVFKLKYVEIEEKDVLFLKLGLKDFFFEG